MDLKITATFERSSKNYHVFLVGDDRILPDKLYIRQSALPVAPESITLTLSTDEAGA